MRVLYADSEAWLITASDQYIRLGRHWQSSMPTEIVPSTMRESQSTRSRGLSRSRWWMKTFRTGCCSRQHPRTEWGRTRVLVPQHGQRETTILRPGHDGPNEPLIFESTTSGDPDEPEYLFFWDFVDGNPGATADVDPAEGRRQSSPFPCRCCPDCSRS
jgi:hypothetical protein